MQKLEHTEMSQKIRLSEEGPEGIRYDFSDGCRVWVPGAGAKWRVQIRDTATDTIVFAQNLNDAGLIQSAKRYYVPFEFTIWKDGVRIFQHHCDLKDKDVRILMDLGGLGDHIAWAGQAVAFQKKHGCRLTCQVMPDVISLFAGAYPHIRFVASGQDEQDLYYAQYKVLVFFSDEARDHETNDYRQIGLNRMGAYILGLDPEDRPPDIVVDPGGRPIKERYVCIGTQASGLSKYWNNPHGWYETIRFLKASGYRVICIDRARAGLFQNISRLIPHGVEDETGDRPLSERARWLKHADFFVGLSSGLSWLAWAAGTPVVMISGFTEPFNEFFTPYRVINRHPCHGCANDVRLPFKMDDPLWCPHHQGTDRVYECTRLISPQQVIDTIKKIAGFKGQKGEKKI